MTDAFERETCSRCNGTGEHSYNQLNGTVCFKCQGAKTTHTKRGAEAFKHLRELRTKAIADVAVGDNVWVSFAGKWGIVTEKTEKEMVVVRNGVTLAHFQLPGCTTVQSVRNAEENAALVALAVAYQATLTASGKPRKA